MYHLIRQLPTACVTALVCIVSINAVGAVSAEHDAKQKSGHRPSQALLDEAPWEFSRQFIERHDPPNRLEKSAGLYSAADWQTAIDSTWGSGLTTPEKIAIYSDFWDWIDVWFACFNDLDPNVWDSVWNLYAPEIAGTVSKGRFSAILTHSCMSLRESHTWADDNTVYLTELAPGIPLMRVGGWGVNDHFGAGLTPMPDSSLLVYKAMPSHPFGLAPGDLVLGYEGIPWKVLYKQLLDAHLPVTGDWWGSSESSFTHSWLMAASNWHLFDTIDVVQYTTGDTLHLATSALVDQNMTLWATEQMDIPGVPQPDYSTGQAVSWGIIDGTTIGYIYVLIWKWDAEAEFYNAVDSLMHEYETTGLIIDFRTNFGGDMFMAHPGLGLLFNDTLRSIRLVERCNSSDHFTMCPAFTDDHATIYSDTNTYYDKPIAVLVGPGAVSGGDFIPLTLALHPMTKLFGKPTASAFNSPYVVSLHPDLYFRFADYESYLISNPDHYLTHDEFPSAVDFPWVAYEHVWLTQEGVAQGRDDVVESAVAWINDPDEDSVSNTEDNCPDDYNPDQSDIDGDGNGDLCDDCTDTDGDGFGNPGYATNTCSVDNCPDTANFNQADTNNDGIGDACCCVDIRGNIDSDQGDVIDISDLVYLVDFMFSGGPQPGCPNEADIDPNGGVDISDLVFLVDYMFSGGPPPPTCP